MTPKPFSDEEIERECSRWEGGVFREKLVKMCRQLLAQRREADAVIHFECEEEDGAPHSDAEMTELDRWEQEAIARHRARSP